MKISYSWLKDYLPVNLTPEETGAILTEIGLEVEGIEEVESIRGGLQGVVTGQVLTCVQHPNADRLRLTTVDVGSGQPLSIVCGAPNVAAGQKVVVALVGATLYPTEGDPITLKKTKIRGEVSEGMICAEDELGLGKSHDGILVLPDNVAVGQAAAEYFGLSSDHVFEIGLTPNRTDAMSHYGVARDLRAALIRRGHYPALALPSVSSFKEDNRDLSISIQVEDAEACPRYMGVTLTNVKVGPSPTWLQNRLKAIGLGPINNVVDITNYVLHETGHPLHAFDASVIRGNRIIVRGCEQGTSFTTLDGKERKLDEADLMICNETAPMCIAGVFGGLHSGVTETTTSVFLEGAYFSPVHIRKTAKRHGLSTDASFRYERGVDPAMTEYALKRAALLIRELTGGSISSPVIDVKEKTITGASVLLRFSRLNGLIGQEIPRPEVLTILEALDIRVVREAGDELHLEVPAYRVDVTREADVIEEVLRIYGLNNIHFEPRLEFSITHQERLNPERLRNKAIDLLANGGFLEMMNNSLTRAEFAVRFLPEMADQQVHILNPLSQDLGVLRSSLLYGGLEAIAYNINRKRKDLSLFECGKVYARTEEGFAEETRIGLWITGQRRGAHWSEPGREATFYGLKAEAERLLGAFGLRPEYKEDQHPDYAESLVATVGKKKLARLGLVHPEWLKATDIKQPVYFAEVFWDQVLPLAANHRVKFRELPRFPEVKRDLALLVDNTTRFADLREAAVMAERKLLRTVDLFDVYEGDKLPAGKKSYALSFVLSHPDKTLTDAEVEKSMERILQAVRQNCGAELRK